MATIGARVVSPHSSLFQLKLQNDTGVIKSTVILKYYEPETPSPQLADSHSLLFISFLVTSQTS